MSPKPFRRINKIPATEIPFGGGTQRLGSLLEIQVSLGVTLLIETGRLQSRRTVSGRPSPNHFSLLSNHFRLSKRKFEVWQRFLLKPSVGREGAGKSPQTRLRFLGKLFYGAGYENLIKAGALLKVNRIGHSSTKSR